MAARSGNAQMIRILLFAAGIAAGIAFAVWVPGVVATLRPGVIAKKEAPQGDAKALSASRRQTVAMTDERIKLAQIGQAKAEPGDIAKRLTVPGTIVPDADRVAHVAVRLAGTVAELRKNIGDDVIKGEVLAVLESREVADAKSEYLAARLANELQQDLANRDRLLWEGRAIPEQQHIKSRNAAAQSAMRFDISRQKLMALGVEEREIAEIPGAGEGLLRQQYIRAPISGRLVERKVELGAAVGRDNLETELFIIVDLSRVWVELSVPSAELALVRERQGVDIAARGQTGKAEIMFVSPLLDRETRAARVVATLENPARAWRPGTFVTAAIALAQKQAAVVIPAGAIQTMDGRKIVFVRTADGFEKRDVDLGERDGSLVEVLSGLSPGETVATTNTFSLKAELSKPADED
jgi:cobalt-zinc-cadmium efflux system membrane fusion protein